jgi:nucleoside-diphosphate-sugar epimerase
LAFEQNSLSLKPGFLYCKFYSKLIEYKKSIVMEHNSKIKVLVTGGSGFVALHCIQQLMNKGYEVRTTLRSMSKKAEVLEALKEGGVQSVNNLGFIETDLTGDNNWDKAMEGCRYVLHVASPIHLALPKHEDDMIRPAVDGTLRVLKAAKEAGVKRVVMTSNFGAVGYSHTDRTTQITEEDWTDPKQKNLSAYNKSKVMAERAAWDFIKKEGGDLELSVINPVGIFGPALDKRLSAGYELMKRIMDGSMKRIPKMTLTVVDVRDLADLHIRAMESDAAKGQRFLALDEGVTWLPEIATFLKSKLGENGKKISTKVMPNWLIRIAALFNNAQAKNVAPQLGMYRNTSNRKAKEVLGWQPRSKEEALLSAAQTLLKNKAVNVE